MNNTKPGQIVPGGPMKDRSIEIDKAVYEDAELHEGKDRTTDAAPQPDADVS